MRLTKSANLVQEEQWAQIDVAPTTQHVVDLLMEAAVSDPAESIIPSPIDAANGHKENEDALAKVLTIEEKSFFVVKATAESLSLLGDYLKIVINLELVVTDVMSRIIEFLKVSPATYFCLHCKAHVSHSTPGRVKWFSVPALCVQRD